VIAVLVLMMMLGRAVVHHGAGTRWWSLNVLVEWIHCLEVLLVVSISACAMAKACLVFIFVLCLATVILVLVGLMTRLRMVGSSR